MSQDAPPVLTNEDLRDAAARFGVLAWCRWLNTALVAATVAAIVLLPDLWAIVIAALFVCLLATAVVRLLVVRHLRKLLPARGQGYRRSPQPLPFAFLGLSLLVLLLIMFMESLSTTDVRLIALLCLTLPVMTYACTEARRREDLATRAFAAILGAEQEVYPSPRHHWAARAVKVVFLFSAVALAFMLFREDVTGVPIVLRIPVVVTVLFVVAGRLWRLLLPPQSFRRLQAVLNRAAAEDVPRRGGDAFV